MEYTTKVEVPSTVVSKRTPPINTTEKLLRIIKIVLKLASVDGYDSEGRVKHDGNAVAGSSIVVLLNHAMSFGHALIGEEAFIRKLKEANIDPDLIVNQNVKNKLLNPSETRIPQPKDPVIRTERVQFQSNPDVELQANVEQLRKRKLEESEEEESTNKRLRKDNALEDIGWEVPKKRKYDDD